MIDWEEGVFTGVSHLYKSIHKKIRPNPYELSKIKLAELRNTLFPFAHFFSDQKLKIIETDDFILVQGRLICLPSSIQLFQEPKLNRDMYFFKTMLASWSSHKGRLGKLKKGKLTIDSIDDFFREYPSLKKKWIYFCSNLDLTNKYLLKQFGVGHSSGHSTQSLLLNWLGDIQPDNSGSPQKQEMDSKALSPQTISTKKEIKGKGQVGVESIEEKDDPKKEMPFHSFEKIETLDEYGGIDRMAEDDEHLDDHEEALSELNMKQVIRSHERTSSIYTGELSLNGTRIEIKSKTSEGIPYPEWDYKKKEYRKAWCRVNTGRLNPTDEGKLWAETISKKMAPDVSRIKKMLAIIQSDCNRKKSQPDGNEFDIDSLLLAKLDILAGHTPSENIYEGAEHCPLNAHIHFLIDASFSTEGYMNGKMILESIKESVYLMGVGLSPLIDSLKISTFFSDTRQKCFVNSIKNPEENWDKCIPLVGSIQPSGYTRIGPALRHAYKEANTTSATKKTVILISDGKPNDYDRYEGRHGMRDVRKALHEGQKMGVSTFALAFDSRSSEHLPQMFPRKMFARVPNQKELLQAVAKLAVKIKYGY